MSIFRSKLGLYNIFSYDDMGRRSFGIAIMALMILGLLTSALYGLRIDEIIQTRQCVLRPLINFFAGMFFLGTAATLIQMEIMIKSLLY